MGQHDLKKKDGDDKEEDSPIPETDESPRQIEISPYDEIKDEKQNTSMEFEEEKEKGEKDNFIDSKISSIQLHKSQDDMVNLNFVRKSPAKAK